MNASKPVAFTMAAMLLLAGVAGVGAAAPAGQASGTAADASADTTGADDSSVGPSGGLPEQVPDHVSGIHDRIESFLSGSIDNLGASLSEFLGGGEQADAGDEQAADGGANESDA